MISYKAKYIYKFSPVPYMMFNLNGLQIDEVVDPCCETLTKYTSVMTSSSIQADLLISLCQFEKYVCWK